MIYGLACGPLQKPRYINPKIEIELLDFKKEIEEKFHKSQLRSFKFPLKSKSILPETRRSSHLREVSTDEMTSPSPAFNNHSSHASMLANQQSYNSY